MNRETTEQRDSRINEERRKSQIVHEASLRALVYGGISGLGVGVGISLLASRFSPAYKSLRLPVKSAFVAMLAFGTASFASEHAIWRATQGAYKSPNRTISDQGILQTIIDHRLAVVGSTIGLAVLGTGYKILQNRNITGAQKFMNVRLYGQMAGLGAIVLLMALSSARKAVPDKKHEE